MEQIIITCHGHQFIALPDHPKTGDKFDCPHCMKMQIKQFETYIDFLAEEDNK
jgi:hypothetical protein